MSDTLPMMLEELNAMPNILQTAIIASLSPDERDLLARFRRAPARSAPKSDGYSPWLAERFEQAAHAGASGVVEMTKATCDALIQIDRAAAEIPARASSQSVSGRSFAGAFGTLLGSKAAGR